VASSFLAPLLYFLVLAALPWALIGRVKTGWLIFVCFVPLAVAKVAGHSGFAAVMGLSFFCFRQVSFLVDYQRGKFPLPSAREYFSYLFFPPTFFLGPLQRFASFTAQRMHFSWGNLTEGLWLIGQGLAYKFLVADTLRPNIVRFFSAAPEPNLLQVYVFVVAFAVQFFCDFAAYTHLARGCARILGFEVPENFLRPYLAQNPQEFWQRWHRSLSEWFRDYVYVPLFFRFKSVELAIFLSFLLMGLWHGLTFNFIALGIYLGLLMALFSWSQPYRLLFWSCWPTGKWASVFSGVLLLHAIGFAFYLILDANLELGRRIVSGWAMPDAAWQVLWKVAFVLILVVPIERWGREKSWLTRGLLSGWALYFTFLVFFFSEIAAQRDLRFLYFQF